MHYILDGYNIIHKIPALEKQLEKNLQSARDALLRFCKSLLQSRGDVEKITVVFDGASDVFSDAEAWGSVEVIYTATGEDADDRILDYLKKISTRRVIVVSDDNYVCNNARAMKARIISGTDFFSGKTRLSGAKKTNRLSKGNEPGKKISVQDQNKITNEYADYLGLKGD